MKDNFYLIKSIFVALFFGSIFTYIIKYLYENPGRLIKMYDVLPISSIPLLAGIFICFIKYNFRFVYGFIEIIFGAVSANYIASSINILFTENNILAYQAETISIIGCLYVIVRGFDNVKEGLKNTDYELTWKNYFPSE